jgi:hypothetical protein
MRWAARLQARPRPALRRRVIARRLITWSAVAVAAPATIAAQGQPPAPAADSAAADTVPSPGLTPGDVLFLPGLWGLRLPSYDRSDGVSLRWGPQLAIPNDRIVVDALLTYRSHLGHVDPSVQGVFSATPRVAVRATVERATLGTNQWSVPDLINSTATLVDGVDGQNYFRADRAEATLEWHDPGTNEALRGVVSLGLRDEYAHSVGPDSTFARAVWSLFDQSARNGIRRPNPAVARGRIISALGGASGFWVSPGGVSSRATLGLEVPITSPGGAHFAQVTGDWSATIPGFADHRLTVFAHGLATLGDTAPPQRFSYVGGTYTLPTKDLLTEGGDELLYVETAYAVPLRFVSFPVVGPPTIGLLYAVGGAGIHRLPNLTQNIGFRVELLALRVDLVIDPVTRRRAISWGGVLPH